ncbi:unnamed protein product, partial [Brassica oleracea]
PLSGASGSNARRNFLSTFKLRVLRGWRRCVFGQPRRSSSRLSHLVPDHQDGEVSVRRRQGCTFLSRCGSVGSLVR